MEQFLETIGSALYDADISDDATMNALEVIKDSYILIQWPESQEFMEEDWFYDEAILDVEASIGDSAYFIPVKRLIK